MSGEDAPPPPPPPPAAPPDTGPSGAMAEQDTETLFEATPTETPTEPQTSGPAAEASSIAEDLLCK